MSLIAGWGRPSNALADEKVHWWKPDSHQACGSDGLLSFSGKKTLVFPDLDIICATCLARLAAFVDEGFDLFGDQIELMSS